MASRSLTAMPMWAMVAPRRGKLFVIVLYKSASVAARKRRGRAASSIPNVQSVAGPAGHHFWRATHVERTRGHRFQFRAGSRAGVGTHHRGLLGDPVAPLAHDRANPGRDRVGARGSV